MIIKTKYIKPANSEPSLSCQTFFLYVCPLDSLCLYFIIGAMRTFPPTLNGPLTLTQGQTFPFFSLSPSWNQNWIYFCQKRRQEEEQLAAAARESRLKKFPPLLVTADSFMA